MQGPLESLPKPGFWTRARHTAKQLGGVRPDYLSDQEPTTLEQLGSFLRSGLGQNTNEEEPLRTGGQDYGSALGNDILSALRSNPGQFTPRRQARLRPAWEDYTL